MQTGGAVAIAAAAAVCISGAAAAAAGFCDGRIGDEDDELDGGARRLARAATFPDALSPPPPPPPSRPSKSTATLPAAPMRGELVPSDRSEASDAADRPGPSVVESLLEDCVSAAALDATPDSVAPPQRLQAPSSPVRELRERVAESPACVDVGVCSVVVCVPTVAASAAAAATKLVEYASATARRAHEHGAAASAARGAVRALGEGCCVGSAESVVVAVAVVVVPAIEGGGAGRRASPRREPSEKSTPTERSPVLHAGAGSVAESTEGVPRSSAPSQ